MTEVKMLWLVAGREVRETMRRKSFWIVAGLLFVAATAAMVIPALLDSDDEKTYDVVVIDVVPGIEDAVRTQVASLDAAVEIVAVGTKADAIQLVNDGDADVALATGDDAQIIVRSGENDRLVGAVRQALAAHTLTERLKRVGLTDTEVRATLDLPFPVLVEVDEQRTGRRISATAATLVLYLLLLTLMAQVASGTAVEKSNRISEVLVAIVRPVSLMFGKILGVGLVGLVTVAAGIIPVVVKLFIGGNLPSGIGATLAGSGAWFILGLGLYLTLAAALGSLVERQEQAGSALAPLTFVLIATFLVAQSGADSTLGTVLAYFPFTSPLVMPARIALGVPSTLELVLSLLILLATIVVVAQVSATVYRRAIVRTGRRLKLRDLLGTAS